MVTVGGDDSSRQLGLRAQVGLLGLMVDSCLALLYIHQIN